jgi:hypothetical protein
MTHTPRNLKRMLRPVVALVLVFAQAVAAFGFPIVQTRHTVKACGCVTPCGASTENCCCSKPKPEPKRPRCAKCVDREELPPSEPKVKWIAAFQAKQCHGETAASGFLAEIPCVPPPAGESGRDFAILLHNLSATESGLVSHISAIQDPPPRRS